MKHAEVIFEPGTHSVLSYDDEDELKGFLSEHNERAKAGKNGGPEGTTHPAERIKKVLLYDQHPGNYGVGGLLDKEQMKAAIDGLSSDNAVEGEAVIRTVRDGLSAVHPVDQGSHESMYKMEAAGELDLAFLDEGGA